MASPALGDVGGGVGIPFGGFFIRDLIFFGSFKNLHFMEAAMERAATDTEFFRSLTAVASTAFESLQDEIGFRVAEIQSRESGRDAWRNASPKRGR